MLRECILLVSTTWDEVTRARWAKLEGDVGETREVWLLLNDFDGGFPETSPPRTWINTTQNIKELGFPFLQTGSFPGCTYYGMMRFMKFHPEYQRVWTVEYDVIFTGNWGVFFDFYDNDDADFLASQHLTDKIGHYPDGDETWWWWNNSNNSGIPLRTSWRTFNTICRYSSALLNKLDKFLRSGKISHQEIIIPTITHITNLKSGFLLPFSDATTNTWNTPHKRFEANKIYHPVKILQNFEFNES